MVFIRKVLLILFMACSAGPLSYFVCVSAIGQGIDTAGDFRIAIPDKMLPIPLPREQGKKSGFSIRGIKGYNWTPEQYLEEIPFLAKYKANFMMNCYLSMFSVKEKPFYKYGNFIDSIENTWRLPIPDEKKKKFEMVFEECRNNGINYCFSMHPQLFADNPLDPGSEDDFQLLLRHYLWAQQKGVKWFAVCLDDINEKEVLISATDHARLVNKLFTVLRKNDPEACMIFCPTYYWGNGKSSGHRPYLETLGDILNPDVYVFWTFSQSLAKMRRPSSVRGWLSIFSMISGGIVETWAPIIAASVTWRGCLMLATISLQSKS